MKHTAFNQSRFAVSSMWLCAFTLLVGLEFLAVHAQIAMHNQDFRSFHFYFVPIMLTLPFSTMFSFHRQVSKVKMSLEDEGESPRISYVLAVSVLVVYVTLLSCMGDYF